MYRIIMMVDLLFCQINLFTEFVIHIFLLALLQYTLFGSSLLPRQVRLVDLDFPFTEATLPPVWLLWAISHPVASSHPQCGGLLVLVFLDFP
jgi:hypothetical protein